MPFVLARCMLSNNNSNHYDNNKDNSTLAYLLRWCCHNCPGKIYVNGISLDEPQNLGQLHLHTGNLAHTYFRGTARKQTNQELSWMKNTRLTDRQTNERTNRRSYQAMLERHNSCVFLFAVTSTAYGRQCGLVTWLLSWFSFISVFHCVLLHGHFRLKVHHLRFSFFLSVCMAVYVCVCVCVLVAQSTFAVLVVVYSAATKCWIAWPELKIKIFNEKMNGRWKFHGFLQNFN